VATATLTASPTVLDTGGHASIGITNTGAARVRVTNGPDTTNIRPGQSRSLPVQGAVTAYVPSEYGTGGEIVWEAAGTRGDVVTYDELTAAVAVETAARDAALAELPGTFASKTDAATIIELTGCGCLFVSTPLAGTDSFHHFVAPFPLKITQFSWSTKSALTASDTDYWEITLRKAHAGSYSTITTKTTKVTGGAGWAAHEDWNYDTVAWDSAAQTFAKGDVLNLAFFKSGNAANLDRLGFTFRYEPI
jgi:hypothetical protein